MASFVTGASNEREHMSIMESVGDVDADYTVIRAPTRDPR